MNFDIVVASDENYVTHMAVLIVSICENNSNNQINMHILDNGIAEATKIKIKKLTQKYNNLVLNYYTMDTDTIIKKLGGYLTKDRSVSTYARVFIPELLNEKIKRAVYFDVDAICCGSLEKIFTMDMENSCIAGVMDCNFDRTKQAVGLKKNDIYINAGMIVWNLEKCRRENVVERLQNFVISRNGNVVAMDQGTINGVLSHEILVLSPQWNCLTPFFQMSKNEILKFYQMNDYYSESDLKEATDQPKFIHFVPNFTTRPWIKNCKHPLTEEYWKYRNLTDFNQNVLQPDNRDFKAKLVGGMFYHLPFDLFIILFNKLRKNKG